MNMILNKDVDFNNIVFLWEKDSEIKKEFLRSLKPSTAKTVKSILIKVDEYEQSIEKSAYDLDLEERDDLLISKFSNKSKGVVRTNISYINGYIYYCIDHNVVRHRENRFALILESDIPKYLHDQAIEMKYLDKSEIKEAMDKIVNNCDKLLFKLIPLGVRGRTENDNTNEELRNLRVKDAKEAINTKKLKLWNNDGEDRDIDIDDETAILLAKTINDTAYIINNGKSVNRKRKDKELTKGMGDKKLSLNETGYIFKTTGKDKIGKVKPQFFNNRLYVLKDWIDNPYMNLTNLYFSGMIEYARQLKEKKGLALEYVDYFEISKKFVYGKPKIDKNGKEDWQPVILKIKYMVEDYFERKGI